MVRSLARGHAIAALGTVAWTNADDARATAAVVTIAALVAAAAMAHLADAPLARARRAVFGGALAASGLALIGVTPRGVITILEAAVLGCGVGLATPAREGTTRRVVAAGGAAAIVEAAALGAVAGRTAVLRGAVVVVVAVTVVKIVTEAAQAAPRGRSRRGGVVAAIGVLAVGLLAWVPANDPTVEWFGNITTHGDRHGHQVAITFDDGPDARWSLEAARILDDHGVKGSFFEVGKAVDARPDITRALHADGQLIGNHSYRHDYTGWLDPRYPELGEAQAAFQRAIGVCPALFRPPHGQRTPFMLAHVSERGMDAVTWDVSARDWTERDGHIVAQRILADVRPGSIILLHDGLDGKVIADRSVLAVALPEILDGLASRGLEPVRLDELLGVDPYLPSC
ncbi:MAG: polysaccharide deacetylase family protein [Acidimicrobiales bacterium]